MVRPALILLLCASASAALGQAAPDSREPGNSLPATQSTARPAPLHHVYWYFFEGQRHLDHRADTLQGQGQAKEAARVRSLLQKELHFSDAQIVVLREAGQQMKKDADAIWAAAMPIMLQDREWMRLNGRSAGPPPGHAQVHALQEEREEIMKRDVAELNRRLGPQAAARLQARIEKEWAPRVAVHQIVGQPTLDPRIDSKVSAPYHLEVQR